MCHYIFHSSCRDELHLCIRFVLLRATSNTYMEYRFAMVSSLNGYCVSWIAEAYKLIFAWEQSYGGLCYHNFGLNPSCEWKKHILQCSIHIKVGPYLPVHELQYARCLDLRRSAQTIPFLYRLVLSKNNHVHDGLRTNQALFKCKNYAVHSSYVQVLVAIADIQSIS